MSSTRQAGKLLDLDQVFRWLDLYSHNRSWSDQFLPEIKSLVGARLLRAAPDYLDQRQATDLLLLDAGDMRIAARVRRPGFSERYPYQFTIRSLSAGGGETEPTKIVNGKVDWMFYGHASETGDGIGLCWLVDRRAFRAAVIRNSDSGERYRRLRLWQRPEFWVSYRPVKVGIRQGLIQKWKFRPTLRV